VNPVLDALLFHDHRLIHPLCRLTNHGFFLGSERARLIQEALHGGRMRVRSHKSSECFNQVPCRTVHSCLITRMKVSLGPRPHFSALETSSSSTTPFAPRLRGTLPSGTCSYGHEYTQALTKGGESFGAADDLREVRRANLFLTLRNKHQVDGQFAPGALECVECGEGRSLRLLSCLRLHARP
jgi:hypothetical protein